MKAIQKGFTLNGRLLRPARVVVAAVAVLLAILGYAFWPSTPADAPSPTADMAIDRLTSSGKNYHVKPHPPIPRQS